VDATGSVTPVPMGDFRRRVTTLYEATGRRPRTVSRMDRVLRELEAAGAKTTTDLTTDLVAAWQGLYSPTRNANTVIGLLTVVKAATSYAIEEGMLSRAPSYRRLRPRAVPPRVKPWIGWEEMGKFLSRLRDAADDERATWRDRRMFALVGTMALSGMRRDEGLYLRREDVHLKDRIIRLTSIPERPLKTASSARPVPLCTDLVGILEAWLPEAGQAWLFPGERKGRSCPWRWGGPGRQPLDLLRRAAAGVGIPRATWQRLRHSWATHAETRWGLSGPAIDRILGHARPGVTSQYTHADEINLVRLVAGVSYWR
jgi:integrase